MESTPLIINIKKREYTNPDAIENLIRYITRTNGMSQNDLISYGFTSGSSYMKPIEEIISEYKYIHQLFKTKGCLMCHYTIRIYENLFTHHMNRDLNQLNAYAVACCNHIFNMGHQVCYAIHNSKNEGFHIHLAINTTNFITGRQLRQYPAEIKKTIEYPLKNLIKHYFISDTSIRIDDL